MTHHVAQSGESDDAGELLGLVRAYWQAPTVGNKAKVYDFVLDKNVIGLIDPFLGALTEQDDVNHDRLYELARSLATESPDREPVKLGIAILGLYGRPEDIKIFRTLGRHDEFTLFCAVALSNAEGAAAVAHYLGHMEQRASTLGHFLAVHTVRGFLADDKAGWADRAERGWTPQLRAELRE